VTAATTPPARRTTAAATRQRQLNPHEEVNPMMKKLYKALFLTRKPARSEAPRFNGQLLDQKRDDVFLALHQAGLGR
jgi:hypothetical protein